LGGEAFGFDFAAFDGGDGILKIGDAAIDRGAGAGAVVGDGGFLEIENEYGVAELAIGIGQGEVVGGELFQGQIGEAADGDGGGDDLLGDDAAVLFKTDPVPGVLKEAAHDLLRLVADIHGVGRTGQR